MVAGCKSATRLRATEQRVPTNPVRSHRFARRLLPEHAARLAVLQGGSDGLLSVRQAAERLGLCTATIYGLCADGALAHIRILNTIRIAPADLEVFIATRRVRPRPRE